MSRNGSDEPKARRPGQDEPKPLPKRFYEDATVGAAKDRQFPVLLDGRSVKTPRKSALQLPTEALAQAVAAEWQAQVERIDPTLMPLTRLANTAIDAVTGQEVEVRADVVKYIGSDLLCYRADMPQSLVVTQAKAWDPVLAWASRRLGVTFAVAHGIIHVAQAPGNALAFADAIGGLDVFRLTSLHVMTTLTGSALLAFAVVEAKLTAEAAWSAAHIDEDFQIARWGADEEAETRRARRFAEMAAAVRLVELLGRS